MAKTPLMAQYQSIKDKYEDSLLFYRLGDFYELFYDDAKVVSHELELTLTGKSAGKEGRVPMCGVQYHAAEDYIYRLIQKGYKVAVCEQLEEPKKAKGLVKRDVIRVITPGTILFENAIADKSNNSLIQEQGEIVLILSDISTGECSWGIWNAKKELYDMFDMISIYQPSETLCTISDEIYEKTDYFFTSSVGGCLLVRKEYTDEIKENDVIYSDNKKVQKAFLLLVEYLKDVMKSDSVKFHNIYKLREDHVLHLSEKTIRNLEITKNMRDGGRKRYITRTFGLYFNRHGRTFVKKMARTTSYGCKSYNFKTKRN